MKWLFLVNDASFLFEFLGKVAHQLVKENEECLVVANSKMAEYEKSRFFPQNIRIISKIDWCIKNYDSSQKSFGDIAWRQFYTVNERFNLRYGYNKSVDTINQLCQFLNDVFKQEKPDVVIGEPPAGLFGLAAYYFCQKNDIPFCGVAESRFPERIDFYDLEWTDSGYEKSFKELKKEDILPKEIEFARDFIEKFISHKTIYSSYYLCKIRFNLLDFIKHYLKRLKEVGNVLVQYFLKRNDFKNFDYESEAILHRSIRAPFRTVMKNFKIYFQKNIFSKIDPKDQYFFFPIQYEPEASTLVLATYYSNQLATIKYVAATLPLPYKLYLKEHPGSIGSRPNEFYREIKKIPNAVLLSPEESTPKIVGGSRGIITMTSTVGMEAALAGKPVYVLGNVFYSYHPSCTKIINLQDLEDKIREGLEKNMENDHLEDNNTRFIISYLRSSIMADIFQASQKEDKNDYEMIFSKVKKWVLEQSNVNNYD